MEDKKFKSIHRPASCTKPPWASIIPSDKRDEVLRKIKQESIKAYGYSLDECSKRKVCFTKACVGRVLPWKSETAKPYLEKMKLNQNFNSNNELVLTNCDLCSIKSNCNTSCAQINDYLNRDKSEEPELIYKDNMDNVTIDDLDNSITRVIGSNIIVPWDALNDTRKQVIKKYLYEQKNFLSISNELAIKGASRIRYEFYAGLTTLSEYGTFRLFLKEKGQELTKKQKNVLLMIYITNLSMTEAAKKLNISKQAVNQIVERVVKKYNLKWQIFVKKHNKKVIFYVPEIFK